MSELFDFSQPIGRMSYFSRIFLVGLIQLMCFYYIPLYILNNKIVVSVWLLLIIKIIWLSTLYLTFCTAIKRAKDLGGSWYLIGGTILIYVVISIIQAFIPEYKTIFLLQYSDIALSFFSWLLWLQWTYLLFFPGKFY